MASLSMQPAGEYPNQNCYVLLKPPPVQCYARDARFRGSILRLERNCLQLINWIRFDPPDAINPIQDDAKAGRFSHMLEAFDKSCFFRAAVLEGNIHVVDGENFVISTLDCLRKRLDEADVRVTHID